MDDTTLIQLLNQHSEVALSQISEKYGKLCRQVAHSILHNQEDVEECLNDTYLGIWNSIPPNQPNSLRAYLCQICRNQALRKFRHNQAAKRNSEYTLSMEELSTDLSTGDTVWKEIEYQELTSLLENFLDGISKQKRVLFMQRYWFCHPVKDIAKRHGISQRNASMQLSRIRKELKKYLTERGIFL